jgi:hypothetical protein
MSLLGGLAPSTDPSQLAIFETYGAVLILNERLAGIETGLGELHEKIKDIVPETEKLLRQQTAREFEAEVLGKIRALQENYKKKLSAIASGDVEGAKERFNDHVRLGLSGFEADLNKFVANSTYELQSAVAAVEILQAINFFRGEDWERIQETTDRYLGDIESRISKQLDKDIEKKRLEADQGRANINELIGEDWWVNGGNRIDLDKSFSYSSSSYPYGQFTLPYGAVHCWTVNVVDVSAITGSSYYATQNPEQSLLFLPHPQEMGSKPFDFCGTKMRRKETKPYWVYAAETADADGKSTWRDLKRIGEPMPPRDQRSIGNRYRTSRDTTARLQLLLDQLNILTYRHEVAVAYRNGLVASIGELRTRTENATEFSGFDLVKELADLAPSEPSPVDKKLFEAELDLGTLETELFRANFAEAGLAFDRRIAAGQARLDDALAAYNNSPTTRLKQVGQLVSLISQLAATVEAIDASISASDGRLQPDETSKRAQREAGVASAGQSRSMQAAAQAAGSPERGFAMVPGMSQNDFDRVTALIERMSHLPVPGKDPLEVSGPIEFELLAAEAYTIMGGWHDNLVNEYGDSLNYDSPSDSNLPLAEKIVDAFRDNAISPGSVNPLLLFAEVLFTSVPMGDQDTTGPRAYSALRKDLDREASRIMDWRTREPGVWRLID